MFNRIAHFLYFLPFRAWNRVRRCFAPKGIDFSNAAVELGFGFMPSDWYMFYKSVSYVFHFVQKENIAFIDIGCGKGLTLLHAKQAGFRIAFNLYGRRNPVVLNPLSIDRFCVTRDLSLFEFEKLLGQN